MTRALILFLTFCASAAHAAMPAPPEGVTYLPGFDRARIVGEEVLVIRAFTSAMADRKEYAGAQCTAQSDAFEVAFTTPARITVPRIRQRPSNLRIRCTWHLGSGTLVIRPALPGQTLPKLNPLATLAFSVLTAAENRNRDAWTYVPAGQMRSVTLQWSKRPGCGANPREFPCASASGF